MTSSMNLKVFLTAGFLATHVLPGLARADTRSAASDPAADDVEEDDDDQATTIVSASSQSGAHSSRNITAS